MSQRLHRGILLVSDQIGASDEHLLRNQCANWPHVALAIRRARLPSGTQSPSLLLLFKTFLPLEQSFIRPMIAARHSTSQTYIERSPVQLSALAAFGAEGAEENNGIRPSTRVG
jgi:hypothetical protein